jgi:hypothetical protein
MRDWQDGRLRYLVHFDDGGSGMRHSDEPLRAGDELRDGVRRYTVARVEQPPNPNALGHAWARLEFPFLPVGAADTVEGRVQLCDRALLEERAEAVRQLARQLRVW